MDEKKAKNHKSKLEEERKELLKEINDYKKPKDFGSDIDHYDEEADEAESFGLHMSISQDLKKRLEDVEVALQKIKDDKYGACEKCGNGIETAILNISPESRYCKNCKKKIVSTKR